MYFLVFYGRFQVMKSTNEITMLLHNNKNGRPKVWRKLVGVSISCFYFLFWFWVFILLIVFLLDFLLWNQSCLKLFSWFFNKSFQGCGSHLFFSWLCISISFESRSSSWVITINLVLYPLFETCNLFFLLFAIACHISRLL
jgi:hypothetical protein